MYLFDSRDGLPAHSDHPLLTGSATGPIPWWQDLIGPLWHEKRPVYLLVEIALAVFLLHVWAMVVWFTPAEKTIQAKPLMMEVSLVSAPKQEAKADTPTPPKPAPLQKKVVKKKPVARKLPKPAEKNTVALPKPAQMQDTEPVNPSSLPASMSKPSKATTPPAETFTEANFRANYAFNPKPEYPRLARNRHWEGKVLLRVQVSAEGLSEDVKVQQSCGHDILDDSAVAAVEQWKFIPAMRGSTPVASSVIVPIIFTLTNG